MFPRLFLVIGFLLATLTQPLAGSSLTVFAAASMREAMERIGQVYEAETGNSVIFSFAGTGILARQIEVGAPADLFISADDAWMNYVIERDAVVPGTVRLIASNELVLIGAKGTERLDLSETRITGALDGGRMAIADTETVPAGRYGKAALESLGLWKAVSARLAPMENVRIALASVARGDTPLGLVYRTDAAIEPEVAVVAELPAESYPEIRYLAALTEGRPDPAAEAFLDFLSGQEAREILQSLGFVTDKVE